jgi:hypothetical protein
MARTERIFEETAMLALDHGCAVFEGEVIPQGGQWQRFIARDPDINKRRNVRLWLEQLADRLFALRNHPQSGFANQTHESVASLLSFGFQGMTVDKLVDERARDRARLPQRAYRPALRPRGPTARSKRRTSKFKLTHRQALMKWGEQAPAKCTRKRPTIVTGKKLDESACYIHRDLAATAIL